MLLQSADSHTQPHNDASAFSWQAEKVHSHTIRPARHLAISRKAYQARTDMLGACELAAKDESIHGVTDCLWF
jgi:hypothetical protein